MFEVGQRIRIINGNKMGIRGVDGEEFPITRTFFDTDNIKVAVVGKKDWHVGADWIEAGYAEVVA